MDSRRLSLATGPPAYPPNIRDWAPKEGERIDPDLLERSDKMIEVAQDKKSPIDEGSNHKSSSKAVDADIDPTCPVRAPTSYVEGMVLDLKVDWADKDVCSAEERTLLTITKTFPVTTSPAMEVTWKSSSGEIQTGVLKFFDRRVSPKFRGGKRAPYGSHVEACWQKLVQSGEARELFELISQNGFCKKFDLSTFTSIKLGSKVPTADTWQTAAKKEGFLQCKALEQWKNEIRVYEQLQSLQGESVPKFYGSTSFQLDVPSGPDPNFFQIGGILIQRINGFSLNRIFAKEQLPTDDVDWPLVCQRTMDASTKINQLGVLHSSTHFGNIIVQPSSMQPFIFDFGASRLRSDFKSEDKFRVAVDLYREPESWVRVLIIHIKSTFGLCLKIESLQPEDE